MPHDEGPTEAGRERCRGIFHANFSAGNLGGISADEVIHRLCRIQRTHWWQNSESVRSQEDDVGGMIGYARNLRVLNKLDRVGATSVLGDFGVGKIDVTVFLQHHVL